MSQQPGPRGFWKNSSDRNRSWPRDIAPNDRAFVMHRLILTSLAFVLALASGPMSADASYAADVSVVDDTHVFRPEYTLRGYWPPRYRVLPNNPRHSEHRYYYWRPSYWIPPQEARCLYEERAAGRCNTISSKY